MSSLATAEFTPQIVTNPPDDEHIAMLARAGLYLPTVTCSQELAEGRDTIEISTNYANIAQGVSKLELRSPITYDLTTSTVLSKPIIRVDRSQPSSRVTLPISPEFTSATAKLQYETDARFWLSALAASRAIQKSPKRPFDLEKPLSQRQLRAARTLSITALLEMVPGGLLLNELSLSAGIAGAALGGIGTYLGSQRLFSIVPSEGELARRSDARAAKYLKNPLARRQAMQLAAKYPVLELQV